MFRAVLIFLGLSALTLLVIVKSRSIFLAGVDPALFLYSNFITVFELSRIIGAAFYERYVSKIIPDGGTGSTALFEPHVSIVIPCKNEEKAIRKTVEKCFEADYPKYKLEVIVINDGSTDGTGLILQKLKARYKRLQIVDWKENRGKRHGMAEGFRRAKGQIVVQLDSDSYIVPETFRQIVEPFRNPEVGAVCAHADPENSDENFLTRMEAAYYFMSFKILGN